jgi:hypothetical protein
MKQLRSLTVAVALATLVLAGCSSGKSSSGGQGASGQTGGVASTADRPSSPAKLTILAPRDGQVVKGRNLQLELALKGAKVVPATTTNIRPDQGHVHVMLDSRLISMNYGLSETLPNLTPGTHVVQVEFVASDHQPFDPRVLTQAAFQVKG